MSSPPSSVPRLARYAGAVLNALAALGWGGIAVMQLLGPQPLYGVLSLVLVVMLTLAAWGFLQRSPGAYGRSFRVHAIGVLFLGAQVVMFHAYLFAPLVVLDALALLCTWLARDDFHAAVSGPGSV